MTAFGLIIVDKPVGPTSHHVVSVVRRGSGVRKVGHAGTLDPRASGVLVLCLGAATRLSEYLSTASKSYEGLVRFGASTDTYDGDGNVTRETGETPTLAQIEAALPDFRGEILQTPPPYSAIKVRGKKAYELARRGADVDLESRPVSVYRLDVIDYVPPDLSLSVECSAGTYIRSLAHDLGERLSTGAYLTALRRTKSGPFRLEDAVPLEDLEAALRSRTWEQYVRPAAHALPDLPIVTVDDGQLDLIRHGQRIPAESGSEGMARAIDARGELVAILGAVSDKDQWHPHKVFVS